jgi:hypothetical protein
MLDIWNHYNGRRGEFRSFDLPAEIVSYGSITDYVPGNYLWRYAGPGSVEDLPCGGHNVSLTLETVPPTAASVVGAQLFISLRLSAGDAAGGEYAPGINETITLSVTTGDAFTAINGTVELLTLSLIPGLAQGDASANGAALSIILWANYGQAASVSSLGIQEQITFSLSPGSASSVATDPDFASVSLLLHMDGSDGSTTFTDSSSNAFTVTANGNAQIRTAQSKFGGASGLFDGTNDSVSAPSASAPSGTEDFTIESWIRPITTPGAGTYLGICALGNTLFDNVFYLFVPSTPGQFAILWNNGGRKAQSADVVNVNQWHHVAITRQSNLFRTFVDGVTSVDTWTNSGSIPA